MKRLLLLLILLISICSSAQIPDSLKVISLPPAAFQDAFKNDTNALLIDVREFFEYKKSRLKNAVNIPSSGNIQDAADSIYRKSSLFLYCTSGYRSKRVGIKFYDKGFAKVYSLDGGIVAWRKAEMEVDKKRAHRPDGAKAQGKD